MNAKRCYEMKTEKPLSRNPLCFLRTSTRWQLIHMDGQLSPTVVEMIKHWTQAKQTDKLCAFPHRLLDWRKKTWWSFSTKVCHGWVSSSCHQFSLAEPLSNHFSLVGNFPLCCLCWWWSDPFVLHCNCETWSCQSNAVQLTQKEIFFIRLIQSLGKNGVEDLDISKMVLFKEKLVLFC